MFPVPGGVILLTGKGLNTNKLYALVLSDENLNLAQATPDFQQFLRRRSILVAVLLLLATRTEVGNDQQRPAPDL